MKTTVTHFLLRLVARALLVAVAALGSATLSTAKNYEVVAPSNPIVMYSAGYKYITIKNLTADTLTVTVNLAGSSRFNMMGVNNFQLRIFPDSAGNNSRIVTVGFSPHEGDTAIAWFTVRNGFDSDTILFWGQDTSWRPPVKNFRILGSRPRDFMVDGPDSVDVPIVVYNERATSATVTAEVLYNSSDYWFTIIGSNPRTIAANSVDTFLVRAHRITDDTNVYALFRVWDATWEDTTLLRGQGNPNASGYHPQMATTVIKYIVPGQTGCVTQTISNPNGGPMTITAISSSSSHFNLMNPTFPFTIGNGTYTSLDICYNPPSNTLLGSMETATLTIYYKDQKNANKMTSATVYGYVTPCFGLSPDTLHFEPTLVGGWTDADVTVTNNSTSALDFLSYFYFNDSTGTYALSSGQSSFTVAASTTENVKIRFTPKVESVLWGHVSLYSDSSDCGSSAIASLRGTGVRVHSDSANLGLFANQTQTMVMEGEPDPVTRRFYFRNNSANNIKVVSVGLNTGEYFHIGSISPSAPPFELAPNEQMIVELEFDADSNGFYRDSLVVVTENAAQALTFSIQGLQKQAAPQSGVSPVAPAVVEFSVSPNPASGPVTFSVTGAHQVRYEIVDLLGRLLLRSNADSRLVWDRSTEGGAYAGAGNYIVRITGLGDDSKEFTMSKRIVLER